MDSRPADPKYVVAEGLDVVVLNANEVLFQFGTRSLPAELFRDPNRRGVLGAILSEFAAGPAEISAILASVGDDCRDEFRQILEELIDKGILAKESSSPIEQYLAYTFTGANSLRTASVAVIGAGQLGTRIARSLVQHGVGKTTLIDDRITDRRWHSDGRFGAARRPAPTSVNQRQARDDLFDLLQSEGVETVALPELSPAHLAAPINTHQLTIVAFEQPSLNVAHLVNRICIKQNRPWIVTTVDGNLGLIGPLFNSRETACYNCYEALSDSVIASRHMARHYRKHVLQRGTGSFFTGLPVYADIVAGYVSLAALHFLLGKSCFLEGRTVNVNFDRMTINTEDVLKLPRCPVCSSARPMYSPPFDLDVVHSRRPGTI